MAVTTAKPLGPLVARYNGEGALTGYFDSAGTEFSSGSSSASAVEDVLEAALPAASADNLNLEYQITDRRGGCRVKSNGSAWVEQGPAVNDVDGIEATTWANRGTATLGLIKRITDLGNKTTVLAIGDGTYWQPLGGAQTIYALAAPITGAAGASSACTLPSITIPAGLMNINGGLEIIVATHTLSSVVSVANTISYTFGGFELFGVDRTTNRRIWNGRIIMNRNSAAVQTVMSNASGTGAYEQAANDPKETTKDTTAAIALAGTATATHVVTVTNQVDEFRVRWIGG